MPLNPYTFPLVPLADLAPELAVRSGMGGWEPYAVTGPSDRLLPFVLARALDPGAADWLACAWVQHADTGARLATLTPTGAVAGQPVPAGGLVLTRMADATTEYFTYTGALVPGLALPCGVPLRLVLDNAYQSPRFYALAPAAQLAATHLLLEWAHDGPQNGVPYGRGFSQQFYVENGALQFLEPRSQKSSTNNPDTQAEQLLTYSLFAQQQFSVSPVPDYLAQALSAAPACKFFTADGAARRLTALKTTPTGEGGGRWSAVGTLEDQTPLLRRGVRAQPLPVLAYDPAAPPARGWRCGDRSDTASDFRATSAYACQVDAQGDNTGFVLETQQDQNPYSTSYGQTRQQVSAAPDAVRCPGPKIYSSVPRTAYATKNNCPAGQRGSTEPYTVPAGTSTSRESQNKADLAAYAVAVAGAQANANAVGTCSSGRMVMLANVFPKAKIVQFDIVRTDSAGDLTVQVLAQADVDDGQGPTTTQSFARAFTLADGQAMATGATITFNGAVLVNFQFVAIQGADPTDYNF